MNESPKEAFIKKIKQEIDYHKFLKADAINLMSRLFLSKYSVAQYSKTIKNPYELVLQFYHFYNPNYYQMILQGIKNHRISIQYQNRPSYANTKNGAAQINLYGDDRDIFILVHEFAHFIDLNSEPKIIPDQYYFLAETFSFYLEKQLENWLNQDIYQDLILARRNNRMYYEARMMKAIMCLLKYENILIKEGTIKYVNSDEMKLVLSYDIEHISDLLMYPLANILSSYLINISLDNDNDICITCLNIDLYDLLDNLINNYSRKKVIL